MYSEHPAFTLLYYDEYHTPVQDLLAQLGESACLSVLEIEIDFTPGGNGSTEFGGLRHSKVDGRDEFANEFIARAIRANATYQRGYNLSAALSRPFLATKVVEHLKENGATNLIHGFAGNDQVRFEMAIMVLAPEVAIQSVASLLGSRSKVNENEYTVSSNIWGRSVEAFKLEDPWTPAPADVFKRVTALEDCVAPPISVRLDFEKGLPVALNGKAMPLARLLEELDVLAKPYHVGVSDMLEDGFVGLKTRAVYEYPAAFIIRCAHQDLESLVLTRRQQEFKTAVDHKWSELVYDGLWFDPQRESLEAYIHHASGPVTGEVRLLLSCGGVQVVARRSPFALYDRSLAVYRAGQDFGAGCSQYLAETMSVPMRASARRKKNQSNKEV